MPTEIKEDIGSAGDEVTGDCELLSMNTGNRTGSSGSAYILKYLD